jgi:hypothetical protein
VTTNNISSREQKWLRSPCLLPICSVCEQFGKVWNRLYLLDNSVWVPLFFFYLCSFSWSRVLYHVLYQIMNDGGHVRSSYCRVFMPVLNTASVLVIVYVQGTEVLAWLQLSFVLTSEIRWSHLINKLHNTNETVVDVLRTSYNDHEFHTLFHLSPGGRGMQVRSRVFVSMSGKNHTNTNV